MRLPNSASFAVRRTSMFGAQLPTGMLLQPAPSTTTVVSAAVATRKLFIGCAFFRSGLLEAVFLRVVANDGSRQDLRNVLQRLVRQLLQTIEVPEVALLFTPSAALVGGHVAEHLAQAVLALVVRGD